MQTSDVSLLVLACPNAISFETPSGPQLEIPPELAPLVTSNTFILPHRTDPLPTSAQQAPQALISGLPQYGWAVSLAEDAGTGDFWQGLPWH